MMMRRVRSLMCAAHFVPIEAKCRGRERDAHATSAGETHGRLVRIVGGVENDGLVAGPTTA